MESIPEEGAEVKAWNAPYVTKFIDNGDEKMTELYADLYDKALKPYAEAEITKRLEVIAELYEACMDGQERLAYWKAAYPGNTDDANIEVMGKLTSAMAHVDALAAPAETSEAGNG